MNEFIEITIWDNNADRITTIDRNLKKSGQKFGLYFKIAIMSEPPLLARMGLLHRVPLLEIKGMFWSLKPGEIISEPDCDALVLKLLDVSNE